MFKHLKNFLIAIVLTFSCIGVVKAYNNPTFEQFSFNNFSYTANNSLYTSSSLLNIINEQLEQKNHSIDEFTYYFISMPNNYSSNGDTHHKTIYIYLFNNTFGQFSLYSSPGLFYRINENKAYLFNIEINLKTGSVWSEFYNNNNIWTYSNMFGGTSYNDTSNIYTNYPLSSNSFDNYNSSDIYSHFFIDNSMLSNTPTIFNFHLNGGHGTCILGMDPPMPVIPMLYDDENFSISTDDYDIYDILENIKIEKDNMIFDGFYYDSNFTQPFSATDNFDEHATVVDDQKVINLYAKYRYKNVDDFLANVNFNEYTFDTNYDYAIINRGDNGNSVYMGLPFSNYELEIYEYQENNNTYKEGASACLVPIFNKNKRYYYELNTLFTNNQEVLILPRYLFDQLDPNTFDDPGDTHKFYLTDNAYVTYTNDLTHVTITNSQGQQIDTNLQNSFELSQQYKNLYENEKDIYAQIKIFLNNITRYTTAIKGMFQYLFNSLNSTIRSFIIFLVVLILLSTILRFIRRG